MDRGRLKEVQQDIGFDLLSEAVRMLTFLSLRTAFLAPQRCQKVTARVTSARSSVLARKSISQILVLTNCPRQRRTGKEAFT